MPVKSLRGLRNYARTFGVLIGDFVAKRPIVAIVTIAIQAITSLLYPLPVSMIMLAVVSAYKGDEVVSLKFNEFEWSEPILAVMVWATILAVGVYASTFAVSQRIVRLNMRWQEDLFVRLTRRVAAGARLDANMPLLPTQPGALVGCINAAVNASALIGRLLTRGVHYSVVFVFTSAAVTWLDWRLAGLMVLISALILPLYARALLRLTEVRMQGMNERALQKPFAIAFLERAQASTWRLPGTSHPGPLNKKQGLSALYSVSNRMFLGLNLVHLVVGLHVVLSLVGAVYLLQPHRGLVQEEFVLLAALIILLRAANGLVRLLASLTRNYANLSLLRQLIRPTPKAADGSKPGKLQLRVASGDVSKRHLLRTGRKTLLRCPAISASSHLVFLSNAIDVFQPLPERVYDHILYLDASQLNEVLLSEKPRTAEGKRRPLVICVTEDSWTEIESTPELAQAVNEIVVFVWIGPERHAGVHGDETPVVVSDGIEIRVVVTYREWLQDVSPRVEAGIVSPETGGDAPLGHDFD